MMAISAFSASWGERCTGSQINQLPAGTADRDFTGRPWVAEAVGRTEMRNVPRDVLPAHPRGAAAGPASRDTKAK